MTMEGTVHEGWLVKSPPEKRILKAKWRQRWFVLRHSGLLPGQYILEYFTDSSCKKSKGKIDLDQCEQVDAGLTFESKKTSYQYMFDIRTPKRIYYLVAETEAGMNKWVDCICSVCGLKIHVDEDYLSPQDSATGTVTSASSNLAHTKSSSNPYIPISECHTGKPVLNGEIASNFNDLPTPPPPPTATATQPSEFYDYPRPLQPISTSDITSLGADEPYNIPPTIKSYSNLRSGLNGSSTLPAPRVNWETYPTDSDSLSLNRHIVPKKESLTNDNDAAYDIVPPLHSSMRRMNNSKRDVKDVTGELEKVHVASTSHANHVPSSASITNVQKKADLFGAPPRPPKPSKLRDRHEYENFEPFYLTQKAEAYDVPPPVKSTAASCSTTQLATESRKESDASISTKVPLSAVGNGSITDDTYDFPKFRGEDNINASVPPPQGTGTTQRQRRHAYTNAPPGLFNSKELIFNYEYRPSLMTYDYVNMDTAKTEASGAAGDKPLSTVGAYANIPTVSPSATGLCHSEIPPIVNRGLKPKKSTDTGPLSFNFLTLQPPPLYRSKGTKRSFRKPGEKYGGPAGPNSALSSGLNDTPPVPNRFRHHLDISTTSEDDLSSSGGSRRNSSNDEQAKLFFSSGAPTRRDEIQYLDLDLDSEPSPSPKSPERVSATVYKKVDFVKTKAFNEMRQNVEESYRKSQ